MRLFFILVFVIFSSLWFQAQAQVLIPGPVSEYDFNEFDWQDFINEENVQKHIDFRNQRFHFFGAGLNVLTGLNLSKLDLIRIELELDLYKQGIKSGLSAEEIQRAEEAIRIHWESVSRIENQIRFWAGLGGSDEGLTTKAIIPAGKSDYYNEVWELYKGDQEVIFNMVEKKDKALYEALGGSDEVYAAFIVPYVERYAGKIGGLAQEYSSSLESAYKGKEEFSAVNVMHLIEMYSDSLKIYNCFKENFKDWEGEAQQRGLEGAIKVWHTQQGLLGMNSFVETYENYKMEYGYRFSADFVVANVFQFREAPEEVRLRMIDFYRNDIFNNEKIKASQDRVSLKSRVNALIGLNYMNALNEEEKRIFNWALEQGIIRNPNKNSFFGSARPLP